jgi:phospholipid/cholesterol/gamma-HCH transport system permease protein
MPAQASANGDKRAEFRLARRPGSTLVIELAGAWHLSGALPTAREVQRQLEVNGRPRRVAFDTTRLGTWDTSLLAFVARISKLCAAQGIEVHHDGLPDGLMHLLKLTEHEPKRKPSKTSSAWLAVLNKVGEISIKSVDRSLSLLSFIGLVMIAFSSLSDLITQLRGCSAQALGILSLVSFLVGTILAFMGAVQLRQFGASIYIADLVGIGITRDMGAMMTAIIMAGRTGAAYAAELGSMKVSEEIDALATMGISPIEFLVLPRMLALVAMMPLLCVYADFLGLLGGSAVAASILGITFVSYFARAAAAVAMSSFVGGLVKATVYGILVAIAGCWHGFETHMGSSAVGEAATAAVVDSIIWIVVACGIFAVVLHVLNL